MASPVTASLHAGNSSCGFSTMDSCNDMIKSTVYPSTTTLAGKKRGRNDRIAASKFDATLSKRMPNKSNTQQGTRAVDRSNSIPSIVSDTAENPVEFLKELFSRNEVTKAWMEQQRQRNQEYAFSKPTPEELANYDLKVVKAVRERDLVQVKRMLQEGHKFDACNRFGESLIHMACRRGDLKMVAFLLDDAHVDPNVCDDFGRRPLHDALWTSQPSLDVVGYLLNKVPPSMFMAEDVRGHTPFHYARREHWPIWVAFLKKNENFLLRRVSIA